MNVRLAARQSRQQRLLLAILLFLQVPACLASSITDTLELRFRRNSYTINPDFDGNKQRLEAFDSCFLNHFSHTPPHSIDINIITSTSPEGTPRFNRTIGNRRGQALRQLLVTHFGIPDQNIEIRNEGPRWDLLYNMVSESHEPWRNEVLQILEKSNTNHRRRSRDSREQQLRHLNGGKVWQELCNHYFAPLRNVRCMISSSSPRRDTVYVRDTIVYIHEVYRIDSTHVYYTDYREPRKKKERTQRPTYLEPVVALKTNILLWAAGAPNMQIELPLGTSNRWSIEAEYFQPWFTWGHNAHAHQCLDLGIEARCWLGNRQNHSLLQGWHIGVALAGGYYNLEWEANDGYQGEYVNTYLNVGYQHRFNHHWAIDFGLGLGMLSTGYRHYKGSSVYPDNHLEPSNNHLIWKNNGHRNWWGPCHANITITYMLETKLIKESKLFKSLKPSKK
ncbi:MAG: DUF3575 domain-containing protein [Prevotella sp.]|nr:DUF3575 domain-containing protein [Prevotella sp.]